MPDPADAIAAPAVDPMAEALDLLRRIAAAVESDRAEALDPRAAAAFLGISVGKLHDLNGRGLIPQPAQIGDSDRLPRWDRSELRAWVLAGAPSRIRWQTIRESCLRRLGAA
jgi:predicted DNA-binding transcriptional regulator AlpA